MEFEEVMETVAKGFEAIGVAIIAVGGLHVLIRELRQWSGADQFFDGVRRGFGRRLILGLEVLIAADIIETITVDRTLESGLALGILVVIRMILSFSLEVEVDGRVPWRRADAEARLGRQGLE